jgi:hypothetical protein
MQFLRSYKQVDPIKERLIEMAENLRKQAAEMPHGVLREELLTKARQAETASRADDWLTSPGLQAPR